MKIVVSMVHESPDAWRAWVPELPGCAARGRSQRDVENKIDEAIRGYLASWDVPVPQDIEEELVEVPAGAEGGGLSVS